MKRLIIGIILASLWACSSNGLHKSGPCDNLQGQAKAECLRYLPSYHQTAEAEPGKKYLPSQELFDASFQKIDDFTDGVINYLFY